MALNGSNGDIQSIRRELVAKLRLRGLSMREIAAAVAQSGVINNQTGEPFTHVTIKNDLDYLLSEWRDNAAGDTSNHRARQLAEIQQIKREAATNHDLRIWLAGLKQEADLLGTAAPQRREITGADGENLFDSDARRALGELGLMLDEMGQNPSATMIDAVNALKAKLEAVKNKGKEG